MQDSAILLSLAELLIKGGVGIAIVKGVWELGKVNSKLTQDIATLQNDVKWLRQFIGTRKNDKPDE